MNSGMGIGLDELIVLVVVAALALSVVVGAVYATVLGIRRLFRRKEIVR